MKQLSPQEQHELLSSYADGELSEEQTRRVEKLLAESEEARWELEQIRAVKNLVHGQPSIPADSRFWAKLSVRLRQRQEEEENLLPFPRRLAPAVAALGVVLLLAAGLALYERRPVIEQFLSEKAEQVQSAYQNGVLKGTLLPLFSNISNDQVLQFAMYGALPLDARAETALRIDESSPQGYRIELGKDGGAVHRPVTVEKLVAEVKPSDTQRKVIDSLLENARKRLSSAVFVAENNALAVDPELPRINRIVLAQIAECLEPAQRTRFDQFLKKHEAAFAIRDHALPRLPTSPRIPHPPVPEQFLIVTPDTFAMASLTIDMDAIANRMKIEQEGIVEVKERVERLMQHFREKEAMRFRAMNAPVPPVRVWGDRQFLEIEFHPRWIPLTFDSMDIVVRARPPRMRSPQGDFIEIHRGERRQKMEFDSLEQSFFEERKILIDGEVVGTSRIRVVVPPPPREQSQVHSRPKGGGTPRDSLNE